MKILFIDFDIPHLLKDDDHPVGGVANEWLSWIEGVKRSGNKVGVLTWEGAKKFINKDVDFDIIEAYDLHKGIKVLRFFYYTFPKFLMAIKHYNPDIILQNGVSNITFMGSIVSKILGKTFIYRVASDRSVDERIRKHLNIKGYNIFKMALKNTDIFLSQNEYQYTTLKQKFPDKKNIVIYPPFNLKNDMMNINESRRSYIAWMGNFRYEKNIAALVPIAKILPDVNFKVTGKPSSEMDKASLDAVEELKILQNVEFVGYIKKTEILPFVSKSIALLNTSYLEGFPTTFLEAWACGTPVITTKNANPDFLITKHKLGNVANSYDELPIIIKNLVDSEPNNDLRIRCREYVKQYHNPETYVRDLIKNVKEINKN